MNLLDQFRKASNSENQIILRLLQQAAIKLRDPEAWVKGAMAATSDGRHLDNTTYPNATKWSLEGAILSFTRGGDDALFMHCLIACMYLDAATIGNCVIQFNDHPATTHDQMLQFLSRVTGALRTYLNVPNVFMSMQEAAC